MTRVGLISLQRLAEERMWQDKLGCERCSCLRCLKPLSKQMDGSAWIED